MLKRETPQDAATDALQLRSHLGAGPPEDAAAFSNFAQDMRSEGAR